MSEGRAGGAVAVVRELLDAIDDGDWDRVQELTSPDFEKRSRIAPEPIRRDRWLDMHRRLHAALPDMRHNPSDFRESGGRVEFNLHMAGTHTGTLSLPELGVPDIPATGRRVEFPPQSDVFEVRDGRVVGGESTIPPGGGIPGLLAQLGHPLEERGR
jgi:predicted ester cyclase